MSVYLKKNKKKLKRVMSALVDLLSIVFGLEGELGQFVIIPSTLLRP